jgi:hypothetical protein
MDDELHAPRFIKETLQHDRLLGRQATERRGGRAEILDDLLGSRKRDANSLRQPATGGVSGRIGPQTRRNVGA